MLGFEDLRILRKVRLVSRARRRVERANPRVRGFTLIELLVVITVIIVLAAMAMAQYRNSVIRSKEAVLKEDLFRLRDSIDQYYADKGQYPSGLEALVSDGYLRKMPIDPFTTNSDSWQSVPSEPDPNNPTAEPGVYDVKSGSDGTAIDGTKYSDW
jgi:general secretion pathway protein G